MRNLAYLLLAFVLVACSIEDIEPLSAPVNQESLQRGQELAQGLAACGFCHGSTATPQSPLSGGRAQQDKYGTVIAANITPAESGIAKWNVAEIMRGFRNSIAPDNKILSQDVHRGYEWMGDDDAIALASYLRVLPAVENVVDRRTVGWTERYTTGLFDGTREVRGYVPTVPKRQRLEYGKYLVDHVGRCGVCHNSSGSLFGESEYLRGGQATELDGVTKTAPDITSKDVYGLGSWSEADIVRYLQTGVAADNRRVDTNFCPVNFYKNASNFDLRSIAAYLKTLK